MPWIGDQWFATAPIRTRQFIFEHHTPIPGLPFTVIPDPVMVRICSELVRSANSCGCWTHKGRRGVTKTPRIKFNAGGQSHVITGARLALLLRTDAPIPVGVTANHEPFCPDGWACVAPLHVYGGTPTDNALDAYLAGRRPVPAQQHIGDNPYPRLLREREARAGQPIRCTRFFAEEVQEELSRGTVMSDVRASRAA